MSRMVEVIMAVTLRLHRKGNRNRAFFRVVAADPRNATSGRIVENLGWYDPRKDGVNFKIDVDRVDYWIGNGALVSPSVKSLVKKARKLPVEMKAAPAEVQDVIVVEEETVEQSPPADIPAAVAVDTKAAAVDDGANAEDA